jgi:hypothetical protein
MVKAGAATIDQAAGGRRRVPIDHRRLPAAPLLEVVHSTARRRQQPLEELLARSTGSAQAGCWPRCGRPKPRERSRC